MKNQTKVTEAEVKINPLTKEQYFTARVNRHRYIGSVDVLDYYNNYVVVTYAREVNSTKRTTLRIMCAIEKELNNVSKL